MLCVIFFLIYLFIVQSTISSHVMNESSKLRALRTHVLTYLACSRVKVPRALTSSYTNVLSVLTCSCTKVPCVVTCSLTNVPCVLSCLHATCLRWSRDNVPYVLIRQRALRAYMLTCQRGFRSLVLTCKRALRAHVQTCITSNNKNKFSMTCFP